MEHQPRPARVGTGVFDWTMSPAKWGAVALLAMLGVAGLTVSLVRDGVSTGREQSSRSWVAGGPEAAEASAPQASGPKTPVGAPTLMAEVDVLPGGDEPAPLVDPGVRPIQTVAPGVPEAPRSDAGVAQAVDINSATEAELQLLPGIGPSRARAIIADRELHGPFRSVADLERVRGIGPGIVEGLRRFARAG